MPTRNNDYAPLNEVWLSIVTAVTTALLVNVVTGYTFHIVPIIQVIVLFLASITIGLYAGKRSDGMMAIVKRIELEKLLGDEKAGERRKVAKEEWGLRRKFLNRTVIAAFALIVISVAFLFYRGWEQRKSLEADIQFRNEVSKELQDLRTAVELLSKQEPKLDSASGANKR